MDRLELASHISQIFGLTYEIQDWGDPEDGCQIWLKDPLQKYSKRAFKCTSVEVDYTKLIPTYHINSLMQPGVALGLTPLTTSFEQLCKDLQEVINYQNQ